MEIKRYDMIVVGAGPAGLSAAIEAAKHGVKPIVFDENAKPGGQLFKQIHKFFGSKEHKAKIRGFQIGKELLAEAEQYGVEVVLNAAVVGLYPDREITVRVGEQLQHYKGLQPALQKTWSTSRAGHCRASSAPVPHRP